MADLKFTNFAVSTIADVGGISSGDTTVNVASGEGALFPSLSAGEYFYAVLVDSSANREIVKCTARSVDALTIARAQDNTTARAFSQGDKIELRVTAVCLEEIQSLIASIEQIEAETVMVFGQNSAPTGWTRKADWQDNAMLCYAASGDIGNGGAANPQSAHSHTGPNHYHSTSAHTLTTAEVPSILIPGYDCTYGDVANFNNLTDQSRFAAGPTGLPGSNFNKTISSGGGSHTHGNTGYSGTGATGSNSAPYYQEVIAAEKTDEKSTLHKRSQGV
jgi:hypothetical protein